MKMTIRLMERTIRLTKASNRLTKASNRLMERTIRLMKVQNRLMKVQNRLMKVQISETKTANICRKEAFHRIKHIFFSCLSRFMSAKTELTHSETLKT